MTTLGHGELVAGDYSTDLICVVVLDRRLESLSKRISHP